MSLFGIHVPLPIMMLAVAAGIAAFAILTYWEHREQQEPAATAPPPPVSVPATEPRRGFVQQHIFGPINPSIWSGLAICAVLALFLYLLMGMIPAMGIRPVTRAIAALGFMGLYFWFSLESVPTGFRAATLFFKTGRYPFLCNKRSGLPEGPNFVPYGIVTLERVDVRERPDKFMESAEIYTKDNVLATVNGFMQRTVTDVFMYLGVTNAEGSLSGLAIQAARDAVSKYEAKDLVHKGKDELSLEIEKELNRLVTEDGRNPEAFKWGLKVLHVVVEDIRVPKEVENAWAQKTRQIALGEAENLEAERRKQQTKTLVETGVRPDTAIAASLINAGKTGAAVTSFSIHGMEELGGGLRQIGEGITRFAERYAGPRVEPPSPTNDNGGQ